MDCLILAIFVLVSGILSDWSARRVLLETALPVVVVLIGVTTLAELGARNRAKDEAAATRASGTTPDQP